MGDFNGYSKYIHFAVMVLYIIGLIFLHIRRKKEKDAFNSVKDMHRRLMDNNARIMALEDNFESLYDVELETGKYESIVTGKTCKSIDSSRLREMRDYFADIRKYINQIIYPEDRSAFAAVMTRNVIKKELSDKASFDFYYRVVTDAEPAWFKMRIVYKDEEKKRIIVGVFNAEKEMAVRLRDEKLQKELINQMMGDDGLFLIDCVNDKRRTLHDRVHSVANYSDDEKQSDIFARYVNSYVAEADRAMMREVTDLQYMLNRTEKEKEYTVQYRDTANGIQRFHEMRIARFSDTEVLQSFKENDKAIVEGIIFNRIESDYFALFCVDLDAGLVEVMKNDYNLLEKQGAIVPYQQLMERMAATFEGETREFLLKLGNTNYLKQRFEREEKADYVYRTHLENGKRWGTLSQFVLTRHEDGTPSLFAFGFSLLDEEANEKEELQHKVKEALSVIGGLASRYETLYYANISERSFKIFSLDGERLPETEKLVTQGGDPVMMLSRYGNSDLIHPDDRALFTDMTEPFIKEKLAHSKRFTVRFRRNFNNDYHWVEMDIVKYEDIDEPANAVAIGFADLDTEIRSEQALSNCFSILAKNIPPKESIRELLSIAGDFYGAERCFIFEFAPGKETVSNTFEWCASGVESRMAENQDISVKEIEHLLEEFCRNGVYCQDSCLAVPIMNGEETVGFIGIENARKVRTNEYVLKHVAVVAYSEILKGRQAQMARYELAKVFSDTFLDSYVSAYYINLTDCSQIVFHRNAFIQESYGHIDNYLESINKYIDECVYPGDREVMHEVVTPEYIRKRLRDESSYSIYMRDISGERMRWYRFDITRGSDEDHAGLAFTDVTDKLAEESERAHQLEEARKAAEAANESKTNFLFNMSHDIRTPMNAISGFTNIAIKHIDDRNKALDCLSKIQQSGSMLLSLINSVLEVSRIESGNASLTEQPGDVYYSFANIESTLRELAETKDITLTFEFGTITDRYVLCDFSRCMRINTNIISNAIKYTREGGFVKVKVEQLGKAENGWGRYCFTVTDNGIGMSEEFQKHVFEQFSREKTATVSGIQGTGLGMSVVKSFVDLMGGTIDCKSKQGEGTTFTTILPFRINTEPAYVDPVTGAVVSSSTPAEQIEKVDFTGRKVLLVEDSELNQEIALEILSEEGLVTECADDGTKAVEMLKERGPFYYDFILMDIQMPIMNGYETTKAIREMFPDAHIPIIALSANAFAEDKAASLAAGMDDHVAKPIIVKELFGTLARLMHKKN